MLERKCFSEIIWKIIVHRMKISSLLYSNRSSQEKSWLDPVRYYIFFWGAKSREFHISLRDFWSQNTCAGTSQLPHASRVSLEGVREAEQTQAGCLAHTWCDCKLNLWHKHHKVNLWMTIGHKWPFFQGYPGSCCSTYVSECLEVPRQMTKNP